MYRLDPDTGKQKFFAKDGTKSVISAVISILIGMVVGTLIIIFVGLTRANISTNGMLEGVKLVFLESVPLDSIRSTWEICFSGLPR